MQSKLKLEESIKKLYFSRRLEQLAEYDFNRILTINQNEGCFTTSHNRKNIIATSQIKDSVALFGYCKTLGTGFICHIGEKQRNNNKEHNAESITNSLLNIIHYFGTCQYLKETAIYKAKIFQGNANGVWRDTIEFISYFNYRWQDITILIDTIEISENSSINLALDTRTGQYFRHDTNAKSTQNSIHNIIWKI